MAEDTGTSTQLVKKTDPPTSEYPEVSHRVADEPAEPVPATAAPVGKTRPGFPTRVLRGIFWLVATIGVIMALFVGAQAVGWIPDFRNPFATQTTDRSQPPLLQSINDL